MGKTLEKWESLLDWNLLHTILIVLAAEQMHTVLLDYGYVPTLTGVY